MQICDINIYKEKLADRVYNATTNTWDTNVETLWTGKARIQPTKISSERTVKADPTFVRQVQFQIDFEGTTIADIRPGNYIIVSNSPYDATLTTFVYVVRTVMNGSNPWQRTITCEVDMESDRNA